MTRFKGFTLIELMVVLALLAIIATIAVPNFSALIRDNRAESQAEALNSLLQYARSEAVIRKIDSVVQMDVGTGEITVSADGENGATLRTTTLDLNNISFDSSTNLVGYRSNGTSTVPDFRAVICSDGSPSTGRLLTISGSGSTTLHNKGKTANGAALGSCSL